MPSDEDKYLALIINGIILKLTFDEAEKIIMILSNALAFDDRPENKNRYISKKLLNSFSEIKQQIVESN